MSDSYLYTCVIFLSFLNYSTLITLTTAVFALFQRYYRCTGRQKGILEPRRRKTWRNERNSTFRVCFDSGVMFTVTLSPNSCMSHFVIIYSLLILSPIAIYFHYLLIVWPLLKLLFYCSCWFFLPISKKKWKNKKKKKHTSHCSYKMVLIYVYLLFYLCYFLYATTIDFILSRTLMLSILQRGSHTQRWAASRYIHAFVSVSP